MEQTYYTLLGVSPKCSIGEIRGAYRVLIKQYHPDKYHDKNEIEQTIKMVKCINKAYEVLKNPEKRREYDNSLKIVKKNTIEFLERKEHALNFLNCQNNEATEEYRQIAQKDFDAISREMDKKLKIAHLVTPDRKVIDALKPEEMTSRVDQLNMIRGQEDIENIPTKICDCENFKDKENVTKFNEAFEEIANNEQAVIEYSGNTMPYNNIQVDSSFIENVDEPELDYFTDCSGQKIDLLTKIPPKKFVPSEKSLEELVEERKHETEKILNMKLYEYKANDCINANGETGHTTTWQNNQSTK